MRVATNQEYQSSFNSCHMSLHELWVKLPSATHRELLPAADCSKCTIKLLGNSRTVLNALITTRKQPVGRQRQRQQQQQQQQQG
jgi:hypothetical protein